MARLLLFLIPIATIAVIVHDHANTCKIAHHPVAGRMPVCE
jgi:NAD/NADP transhydrogenase beta subunit